MRVPELSEGRPDVMLTHAKKTDVLLGTGFTYECAVCDVDMSGLLFLTVNAIGIVLVFTY